jgi:hypothetical protein
MPRYISTLTLILLLISTSFVHASDDGINISKITPYSEDSHVAANIKSECQLGFNIPQHLQSSSGEINLVPKVDTKAKGKNMLLEITDAVSAGNAWTGHRKYASVKGTLYENGKKLAGFEAGRVSGGGAFGGFKGSCSILDRIAKVIAKDISIWLIDPVDGVFLGDR